MKYILESWDSKWEEIASLTSCLEQGCCQHSVRSNMKFSIQVFKTFRDGGVSSLCVPVPHLALLGKSFFLVSPLNFTNINV